jgi:DNA-binding MarR family transcriptional regulator
MVLVFLEVCQNKDGLTVGQVRQRTGLSQSSASRHCRGLTKQMTPTREGLNLCHWIDDPKDFRSKLLVLNENGKELEAALEQAMK